MAPALLRTPNEQTSFAHLLDFGPHLFVRGALVLAKLKTDRPMKRPKPMIIRPSVEREYSSGGYG
jgi:hypothetical protein